MAGSLTSEIQLSLVLLLSTLVTVIWPRLSKNQLDKTEALISPWRQTSSWLTPDGSSPSLNAPESGTLLDIQEVMETSFLVLRLNPIFIPGSNTLVGWSKLCHTTRPGTPPGPTSRTTKFPESSKVADTFLADESCPAGLWFTKIGKAFACVILRTPLVSIDREPDESKTDSIPTYLLPADPSTKVDDSLGVKNPRMKMPPAEINCSQSLRCCPGFNVSVLCGEMARTNSRKIGVRMRRRGIRMGERAMLGLSVCFTLSCLLTLKRNL
ncbi:unnamed protein product [Thlaspi arvense]|uniref:Uncharacterized protein n=1 Tax=Thlaspi arvense TaxID=13288 RepID=A0AAU9SQK7_THLAR|nr:unnamed protein product [Thlaspi arvense]